MTIENIQRVRALAQRFIHCVDIALKTEVAEWETDGKIYRALNSGKLSGALRRASMDLTRALAEMRKP